MKRTVLLVLIVALAGLMVGAWYIIGGDADGRAPGQVTGPSVSEPATPAESPKAEISTPTEKEEQKSARQELNREEALPASGQNFTAVSEMELQLEAPASPPDDTLTIFAFFNVVEGDDAEDVADDYAKNEDPDDIDDGMLWATRSIETNDNAVRIPKPEGALGVALLLRGHYLTSEVVYLEMDGEAEPLVAKLGTWITGRVVLPDGWEGRGVDLEEIEINLALTAEGAMSMFFGGGARSTNAAEDLSFQFNAAIGEKAIVLSNLDGLVPYRGKGAEMVPGERLEVEVPFKLGGAVLGRVLSETGEPIEGSRVQAGGGMLFSGFSSGAETDADGKYAIYGIRAGKVSPSATADGWTDGKAESFQIADGEQRLDVDVLLSRGASVNGRVLWPDGRPAVDATVTVSQEKKGNNFRFWDSGRATFETDAEGRFRVTGLLPKDCVIRASIQLNEEGETVVKETEPSPDNAAEFFTELGNAKDTEEGERWVASAPAVGDQLAEVVLTLEGPGSIKGRVVDDTGAPIEEFEVTASPNNSSRRWDFSSQTQREFTSEEGVFEFEGLHVGSWTIDVTAEGYSDPSDDPTVEMPQTTPLEIVLSRGAVIAGRVLDPSGLPVAEADVTASAGNRGRGRERATTSEDGNFEITELEAQSWTVTATHDEWAESLPLAVELLPATTVDELVLILRVGGRITGEVFTDAGEPDAGQNVSWGAGGRNFGFGGDGDGVRSDENGRFVLEHVTPGKVTVTAMPGQEELFATMADAEDESSFINIIGQMRTASVEVIDGEESHVVLGGSPKSPVTVHGIVREGGKSIADVTVIAISEGGGIVEGMKAGRTDDGGRFEIVLDRPGAYVFHVSLTGPANGLGIEFYEDIPETSSHAIELDLPTGRIEGVVLGPDGAHLADIALRVSNEEGVLGIGDIDESSGVQSDADGRFSFEHLWPGSYTLRASSRRNRFSQSAATIGTRAISGIELRAHEVVDSIVVELSEPGTLKGTVRDTAGNPVGGASIFARDSRGQLLSNIAYVVTDPAGNFSYDGLPEGEVNVSARSADMVSARSTSVRIVPGSTAEVELTIETGSFLVVTAQIDGTPVRARLRVIDASGQELQSQLAVSDLESLFTEGFSSKERRVGPVPPGTYRVIGTAPSGEEASRKVTVRPGQAERKVKLRLK